MSYEKPDPALQELATEVEEIAARVLELIQVSEKFDLNKSQIDALYRDVHTLKGSCLLFGFGEMGALAHELESRMEPVRKGELQLKNLGTDKLLKAMDLFNEFARTQITGVKPDFKEKTLKMANDLKNNNTVETSAAKPAVSPVPVPVAVTPTASAPATPAPAAAAAPADETNTTVRVSVSLLDNLMAMMSEMVLVRNQVLQISNSSDDLEFLNLSQRLDVVTSELQSEVMKTRMQPIGIVLSKFQRVVRDLSKELNKKIDLTLEGTETELDKSLIEAIKDPLSHIVRNACDHGLETTEERKAIGKSETGQILIRSFHEGGQVIIQISDNGRGLNREKLIKKAIEKGIITQERALKMSDREAHEIIFAAGFSTATNVTNISGRGVGMDVVKNNIEKIGGRVELKSEFGKGMTLSLKIPLTLAIVPAMIIKSGTEKYAIPQVKLVELVRIDNNDAESGKIEYIQGKPVYRLRGKLMPLVILGEVLSGKVSAEEQKTYNIVVLNSDNRYFGLVVDEIHDTADIVVKPLSRFLKNLSIYSGATVLGDGSVSLILDVIGLAKYASLTAARNAEEESLTEAHQKKLGDLQEFLLCKVGSETVHGLPLAVVHRLEEFAWDQIQMSGQIPVVQYRDQLLPLMSVGDHLGYRTFNIAELSADFPTCKAVVIRNKAKLYALQVNEILDVISTDVNIDDAFSDRKGVLGSILVHDQLSVIIDAYECVDSLMLKMAPFAEKDLPETRDVNHLHNVARLNQKHTLGVLLAEDSNFFKRHISKLLVKAGFNVTHANNGAEGLELFNSQHFDLVISDIEMPVMNGLEMARGIRETVNGKKIPMIAITTRFSDAFVIEGKEAGFDEYLEKLREVELMEVVHRLVQDLPSQPKRNIAV